MATITITNEDAVRIIRELAAREGKSETEVVMEAVTEKAARIATPRFSNEVAEYWAEVGRRNRETMTPEQLAMNADELLYDEHGLPH